MAQAASKKKKKVPFSSKLDLNLRKRLVKCYFWIVALYVAETWTLRTVDHKYPESWKCDVGEGRRRSVGPIVCEMKKCSIEIRRREISYKE